MHEKEFLLNKIDEDLPDNESKEIDPNDLRTVLAFMLDRWFKDSEIKVTSEEITATNLKAALEELKNSVSTMTGNQIVAALEGLEYADKLSAEHIRHQYGQTVSDELSGLRTRLDISWYAERIYHNGTIAFRNGIIYRSKQDNNSNHEPPATEWWQPITGIDVLSKESVAALLNQIITVGNMIRSDRISYGSATVKSKLDTMQTKLSAKRITYADPPNNVLTISGVSSPIIQMAINRVPYQGYESDDFEDGASAYDFIFRFDGADIQIMLHPSLGFNFEPDDLIDLIF